MLDAAEQSLGVLVAPGRRQRQGPLDGARPAQRAQPEAEHRGAGADRGTHRPGQEQAAGGVGRGQPAGGGGLHHAVPLGVDQLAALIDQEDLARPRALE